MNQEMKMKLEQFAHNKESIKEATFLSDKRIAGACACLFAMNGQEISPEDVKSARELLKSKVGFFSNFRGYTETAICCMLAGSDEPEALLDRSLVAYNIIKENFFFRDYLPMAAVLMAESVPESQFQEVADRTHQIYKLLKKDHPLLTGEEDELMCVLLALQDATVEQQAENCEYCYRQLKGNFGLFANDDGVQSLAEVIAAAGGDLQENCQRAIDLYHYLKESGNPVSNGYSLGGLAALAILPVSVEELGEKILEIGEALKEHKEYGFMKLSDKTRIMHAILLLATEYANDKTGVLATIQGTISMIIAEEIMIICMITSITISNSTN